MRLLALLLITVVSLVGIGGAGTANAAQTADVTVELGPAESRGAGVVVPIALTSSVERVAAMQFAVDHVGSVAPLACEIASTTPGLTGSCRVGPDATRFSVFTLQGLDPGTSDVGLLVIGSPADAPVNIRITTAVDATGTRLQAAAPPSAASAPIAGAGVATPVPVAPAIVGDNSSAGTTPLSPAIGAGVAPLTVEAPAAAPPAPATVEPAPAVTEPAPAVTEPAPAVTEPAPAVTEPAPVVPEPAPAAPPLVEAEPVPAMAAMVEPIARRSIAFVGPDRNAARGAPWGFRSSAEAPVAVVAPSGRAAFGASPELQAGATAVLSGCLLAGGVLVANRRLEPAEGPA